MTEYTWSFAVFLSCLLVTLLPYTSSLQFSSSWTVKKYTNERIQPQMFEVGHTPISMIQKLHQHQQQQQPMGRMTEQSGNLYFTTGKRHQNTFLMATSRGGGSTKLDTRTTTQTKTNIKDEIEKDWRLILHDDNMHTIQQVCEILGACCPLCAGPRAYEVTLEVHMTGAGTVAVANKKVINEYSRSLQAAGLTVSMAPDDDFEDSGGEE